MFGRLLILFIVVPLIELWLLLRLHDFMGLPATILLVMCTGFLGATLAKQQGFSALAKIQQTIGSGKAPGIEIVEGVLVLVAGAVLITPGILTDVFGFSLLIPPVRRAAAKLIAARYKKKAKSKFQVFTTGPTGRPEPVQPSDPNVIDVEFERVPDEPV